MAKIELHLIDEDGNPIISDMIANSPFNKVYIKVKKDVSPSSLMAHIQYGMRYMLIDTELEEQYISFQADYDLPNAKLTGNEVTKEHSKYWAEHWQEAAESHLEDIRSQRQDTDS